MKKLLIMIFLFNIFTAFAEDDLPMILLPTINIEMEDIKKIDIDTGIIEGELPDLQIDSTLPKPDFSEEIKIDLEKTLPQKIESPEGQKSVDALIIFGYGLNNYLYTDFSIFVKQFNPQISIHYLREAKENLWFDRTTTRNPVSLDDLNAELLYNYKIFDLGAEVGYYAKSYYLQDISIYDVFTKRIINVDLGPSFKFNFNNDITLRVLNSFFFTDLTSHENDQISLKDFDYILQADIIYTQLFGNNHYFTSYVGYDFNYLDTLTNGDNTNVDDNYDYFFFNNIKAGINYSTILIDSFHLKASTDFLGMFRGTEFFWYIIPHGRIGYSFQNFFHCYIEGGATLLEKPDRFWFKELDHVKYPAEITPGYHWFAKTGIKGSVTGWFSANVDFEYAYNMEGYDWKLLSDEENLYTLQKRTFTELNLGAGLNFNVKEYFEIEFNWIHYFFENRYLNARDKFFAKMNWAIPKIGLSLFVDFEGHLYRLDLDNTELGNIYLMNAGIDWGWQERIGFGAEFRNILYFQDYQIMPSYDEPGFEFLAYVKIGF